MAKTKKSHTVIGVFQGRMAAEAAIRDLKDAGFPDNTIGMVTRNDQGELVTEKAGATMAEEGLATGAVLGAGAGALVGLGVVTGTIPIIGPILALGTLGTVLLNAAAGAAVAGVVGALVGMGIPEEDAKFYERELLGGRFLVSVEASDRDNEAWRILHNRGAYNLSSPLSEPPRGANATYHAPSSIPTNYPAS